MSMQHTFLLIQYRTDAILRQMEYDAFAAYLGLEPEQLTALDARETLPTSEHLQGHTGLIVGGNGDALISDDRPWNEATKKLLRYTYNYNIPTLAVCYGAQYAAVEFGGVVETRKDMSESGTYTVTLTEAAAHDPLFAHINSQFKAQQGHNDSITQLPAGAELLAYSERAPVQAFHFPGKPFYAVQFHPELDAQHIRFRFEYYKDHYANDTKEFQDILNRIEESTEASAILQRFTDYATAYQSSGTMHTAVDV